MKTKEFKVNEKRDIEGGFKTVKTFLVEETGKMNGESFKTGNTHVLFQKRGDFSMFWELATFDKNGNKLFSKTMKRISKETKEWFGVI